MWQGTVWSIKNWKYHRLAWSVPRLEFAQEKLQAEGYHSQWGQDKWIVEALLPGMESGVFVDCM
jgi:hypothetical protein